MLIKRRDLVQLLLDNGWVKVRNGRHEVFNKPGSGRPITISWQREINERVAKTILSEAGIKPNPR